MSSSEPSTPGARRFLAWLLATMALLGVAALGVTWVIDPYGLLAARGLTPAICTPGIRVNDDRFARPALVRLHQPGEILLGSSRALWAFREDSFTGRTGRTIANLSLAGASLEEIDWLARQAIDEAPVRRVWLGMDFGAFAMPERAPATLTPLWAVASPDATALRYGLLDPHALRAGMAALFDPASCADPPFTPHGFPRTATPHGGTPAALAVLPGARTRADLVRRWRFEERGRAAAYARRMARFEALLATLRRRGVPVILFITPSHPAYDSMLAEAGLGELYRRWRDELRAVAERHGATLVMSDSPAFLAAIRAPDCPAGAPPLDCLFYDATHARPFVGDAIVAAGLEAERARAGR